MLMFLLVFALLAGSHGANNLRRAPRESVADFSTSSIPENKCSQPPFQHCRAYMPRRNFPLTNVPNADELKKMCPELIGFADCVIYFLTDCESPFEEHRTDPLKHQMEFIRELCNPVSSIRERYSANAQCLKNLHLLSASQSCHRSAQRAYGIYRTTRAHLPPLPKYVSDSHQVCLETAFTLSCVANKVKNNCGDDAYDVFLDIMEEIKIIEYSCSTSDKVEGRGAFLKSLIEEGFDDYWSTFHRIL